MKRHLGKQPERPGNWSRRDFLSAAVAAMLTGTASRIAHGGQLQTIDNREGPTTQPSSSQPAATQPTNISPWWLGANRTRSRVVVADATRFSKGARADEVQLADLLAMSLQTLVREASPRAAVRTLLGKAERIALKFNSVGAETLQTTPIMARVLIDILEHAGYRASQISLIEVSASLVEELGTAEPEFGWGSAIEVGNGKQELARNLTTVDAIINVPFLKTHHIAGMSGAMKNISHAIIRHPGHCHDNGCTPFVGNIIGHPTVSRIVKLNVVNALRVVLQNGPEARQGDIADYGHLLVGVDPVAVDVVGRERIMVLRRKNGLKPGIDVSYLARAAQDGVGRGSVHEIEQIPLPSSVD